MSMAAAFYFIVILALILLACLIWQSMRNHRRRVEQTILHNQASGLNASLSEAQNRLNEAHREIQTLREEKAVLKAQIVMASERLTDERRVWLTSKEVLLDQFKSLAADTLSHSNETLLKSAESILSRFKDETTTRREAATKDLSELMKPIKDALAAVDGNIKQIEKQREGAYEGLKTQVSSLIRLQNEWAQEVTKLSQALKAPITRGKWGEFQLKRVVEMAGLDSYCDFTEQTQKQDEQGQKMRPDMVVHLPGQRQIIIDAKTPLVKYFEAMDEAKDEQVAALLKDYASAVRRHIISLGQKSYWAQFEQSPDFVILFLPGDHFYAAALRGDPTLIDLGIDLKVFVATPTTLVALLRAVGYGWRQEQMADNAKQISDVGKELYVRVIDFAKHMSDVGKSLEGAVDSYNKSIFTMENRVLASARKLEKLGIKSDKKHIGATKEIETTTRKLRSLDPAAFVELIEQVEDAVNVES